MTLVPQGSGEGPHPNEVFQFGPPFGMREDQSSVEPQPPGSSAEVGEGMEYAIPNTPRRENAKQIAGRSDDAYRNTPQPLSEAPAGSSKTVQIDMSPTSFQYTVRDAKRAQQAKPSPPSKKVANQAEKTPEDILPRSLNDAAEDAMKARQDLPPPQLKDAAKDAQEAGKVKRAKRGRPPPLLLANTPRQYFNSTQDHNRIMSGMFNVETPSEVSASTLHPLAFRDAPKPSLYESDKIEKHLTESKPDAETVNPVNDDESCLSEPSMSTIKGLENQSDTASWGGRGLSPNSRPTAGSPVHDKHQPEV